MLRKLIKRLFFLSLFVGFVAVLAGGVVAFWAYNYITRDLPDFHNVEEYLPPAVSTVVSDDGTDGRVL